MDFYRKDVALSYRDAERHRRQTRRYDRAIKNYEELAREYPDTIWAEAAGFYTGWCLRERGKLREAAGWWRKFIADDLHGLYRGEAMIALGDLTLEHDLNAPRAIERYRQAIDWLATIEEHDRTENLRGDDLPGVEERARQVAAAAEARMKRDGWGNVVAADNRIGAVVNRSNTPWYLDKLRYDAHLKLGFAHAAAGNQEQAAEAFTTLQAYDARHKHDRKRIWDTTTERLLKGLAPGGGGPRSENVELKVFKGKRRTAAFVANFYYDALEWDKARKLYTRFLDGEMGKLTLAEEAYAVYLLGNIDHMSRRRGSAIANLNKFLDDRYADTPIAEKALYALGAICSQYRSRGDEYLPNAIRAFRLLCKRYPHSNQIDRALLQLGLIHESVGKPQQSAKYYHAYLDRFPDGGYAEIIREQLEGLGQD